MKQESLLAKIGDEKLFVCVQCDLEVPDGLNYKFSDFPPIFKNFNVSRVDIGDYMRVCSWKKPTETTSTNVDFDLQVRKWDNHYYFTQLLSHFWTEVHNNL